MKNSTANGEQLPLVRKEYDESTYNLAHAIKEVAKSAIPFSAGGLVSVAGDFICVIFLSKVNLETLSASALMTTTQKAIINTGIASLFSTGILIGNEYGTNDAEIGKLFQQSLVQGLILSVPSIGITYFIAPILQLLGQEREISLIVQEYFRAYAWGVPATFWMSSAQQLVIGISRPGLSFNLALINTLLKTGFAYCFILGNYGFPRLGAAGFGYANTIAAWVTIVVAGLFFTMPQFKKIGIFKSSCGNDALKKLKILLKMGGAIGAQIGSEVIALQLTTMMVGWLNRDALIASEISTAQYLTVLIIPIFGIGQACGVIVTQAVRDHHQLYAKRVALSSNILGSVISITALIAFCAIPEILMSPFIDVDDPKNTQIVRYTRTLFIINGAGQVVDTIRNISAGALRGLYDTNMSMWTGIVGMGFLALGLGYGLGFLLDLGLDGIFIARDVGIAIGGGILFTRWINKIGKGVSHMEQNIVNSSSPEGQINDEEGHHGRCSCLSAFFKPPKRDGGMQDEESRQTETTPLVKQEKDISSQSKSKRFSARIGCSVM